MLQRPSTSNQENRPSEATLRQQPLSIILSLRFVRPPVPRPPNSAPGPAPSADDIESDAPRSPSLFSFNSTKAASSAWASDATTTRGSRLAHMARSAVTIIPSHSDGLASSGTSEFAAFDAAGEGVVLGVCEQVRGLFGVLGVAQGHDALLQEGDLDAVGAAAAEAAGLPASVAELGLDPVGGRVFLFTRGPWRSW